VGVVRQFPLNPTSQWTQRTPRSQTLPEGQERRRLHVKSNHGPEQRLAEAIDAANLSDDIHSYLTRRHCT
jgi:hypothetical protein